MDFEWFSIWWHELSFIGKIFACSAIPMTVVMILQFVLMIIGVGFGSDSDGDAEVDSDVDTDFGGDGRTDFSESNAMGFASEGDASIGEISPYVDKSAKEMDSKGSTGILKIFTIRGIVAFFALGGWAGLTVLAISNNAILAIIIAVLVGVAAMQLAAIAIRLALRMQQSGNLHLANAISQTAEVYIRIPPSRSKKGKVTVMLQERLAELDAVTDSDVELLPRSKVEVIALASRDCLLVSPLPEDDG